MQCSVQGCHNYHVAKGFCSTHYKRWQRHRHVLETRDADWGARESHPLYKIWHWQIRSRTAKNMLVQEWLDLWTFVKDVGERPSPQHKITPKDKSLPLGPDNFYWRKPNERTEEQKNNRKLYMREWQKKRRATGIDFCKDSSLKKQYGINFEQYSAMHESQNGVCAICKLPESAVVSKSGKKRRLAVDHCHATGKIRGLLCSLCNRGLGAFKDSAANLQSAIEYLKL